MNNTLEIKLLSDDAKMPERHHETDAGYDIYASETKILEPQDKAKIKTDVAVNIPKGYVGLLTSRSGVSSDSNLVIETGKIDAGFQGHMKINIKNDEQRLAWEDEMNNNELEKGYEPLLYDIKGKKIENGNPFGIVSGKKYQINKGDKLAQLVIVPIWTPELQKVDEFSNETARGQNGFGSTGI
ncbi:dUTP diphosphatase [Staphylococcus saprophyticus]|uniref:dUTP diphosphatase n=1 Tax=Staphylococcus saprophyticus TaxID=29385 RepID=UPI003BF69E5D